MLYDLLIKGGTLVDPAAGIHAPKDVAFAGCSAKTGDGVWEGIGELGDIIERQEKNLSMTTPR